MKNYQLVSAIIGEPWLISPQYAQAQEPLIKSLLEGRFQADENAETAAKNDLVIMSVSPGASSLIGINRYTDFSKIPKDSIAVINIVGPVLKYDAFCGPTGSVTTGSLVLKAAENPNVKSILFLIDTPGGQVAYTPELAAIIKSVSKPTIGLVSDLMASAGMWLGSAMDEIYAENNMAEIGSIGVYCAFIDQKGKFEKEGSKIYEIYAPQSTEKNKDYRDALAGKPELMESKLAFIADQFIQTVKDNRGDRLNLKAGDPFKGAMFYASEAQAIGLIDGIKSLSEVVAHLERKGSAEGAAVASIEVLHNNPTTKQTTTDNTMKRTLSSAWTAMIAVLGFTVAEGATHTTEEMTDAHLETVNAELARLRADAATHADVAADLATTKTALATQQGLVTDLTAAVAKFGAQPGAMPTTAKKEGTDIVDAGADTDDFFDPNAEHNVAAAAALEGKV